MRVLLALPAYNEEQDLPHVLESFRTHVLQAGFEGRVVIVNDGSADGTARVIREWSARVPIDLVEHKRNLGLGETIKDALRRASELAGPEDVIVTMDADNTHSPALIPHMIGRLREGYDVVIASRYRRGSKVVGLVWFRRVMCYGARFLFQARWPIRGVRDYTCGFRAYRADLLRRALGETGGDLAREKGFAAMAEILILMRTMGARMSEVPMILRYDRKSSPGKMRIGRTVWRTLAVLARGR
ncbi:MAG TPA: glycosyltransferase [Bryobacteraceae bacterium]|jgi:dolichol-phosphate mannosyltransferase|nr:glycosyltransferase [Bryobacteraceae bacterium]